MVVEAALATAARDACFNALCAPLGVVITKGFIDPVKNHVYYLIYYKSNLKKLDHQVGQLEAIQERLKKFVEEECRQGKVIYCDVVRWLVERCLPLLNRRIKF